MSLLLRVGEDWADVQSPSVVVAGERKQVIRGEVLLNGQWVRFFPHEETTVITVTSDLSGMIAVGTSRVVEGLVTPASGGIAGGTVTIEARTIGGPWVEIGSAAVAPAGGPATWGVSATPVECGAQEFRAVYSGTPTNSASSTEPSTLNVGLVAPVLTGGRIEDEALTFSWPAVPGATSYDVRMNGVSLGEVTGLSATAIRLAPATAYTFTVVAKRGGCVSAESAPIVGTTSRSTVQDSGSATIKIDPLKTNSYRPDVGWGYISSNVGQGYSTDSGRNYTGVIDYGPNADFKAKIAAALGTNGAQRAANLTVTKAEVWLYKQTGVGSSGSVKVAFFTSTAEAGVGGLPARANPLPEQDSTSNGAGKWYDVSAAYGTALLAGTARSIALYKLAAATAYLRFNGKGLSTDACVLRMDVSWNYQLSSSAPGGWA